MDSIAKLLMIAGVVFLVFGALWQFGGNMFNLGKLPGDIMIKKENFTFYFPITTAILLSIVLSLLFWAFQLIKR
ncbi:DUF2905 domain-containing protein [Candidatus Woesearchaeota archaeon]|jgi:quinol-cytochrome oxidoreductase complex cytochrome b subunit|nr:DUF2905 domain-containing protein [Candidatus Woesearchaeota archaeon]